MQFAKDIDLVEHGKKFRFKSQTVIPHKNTPIVLQGVLIRLATWLLERSIERPMELATLQLCQMFQVGSLMQTMKEFTNFKRVLASVIQAWASLQQAVKY